MGHIVHIQPKSINWLLISFLFISIGIHTFMFIPIVKLFNEKSMTYIEFSLEETVKPYYRSIPRPRRMHKIPKIIETKAFHVRQQHIKPMKIEPDKSILPKELSHSIDLPAVPDAPDMPDMVSSELTQWQPMTDVGVIYTKDEYIDMLRISIERHKKYPQIARIRNIEGHVKVEFEICQGGKVKNIKIIQSSGRKILDQAAMDAINNASPLPIPPQQLFKLPLKLIVPINFELN